MSKVSAISKNNTLETFETAINDITMVHLDYDNIEEMLNKLYTKPYKTKRQLAWKATVDEITERAKRETPSCMSEIHEALETVKSWTIIKMRRYVRDAYVFAIDSHMRCYKLMYDNPLFVVCRDFLYNYYPDMMSVEEMAAVLGETI